MVRASRNVSNIQRAQAAGGGREAWPLKVMIRAEAGSTRIDILDDIGDGPFGGGLSAKDFAAQLADIRGPLTCHISSCGGDVFQGLSIFNALQAHKGHVTTIVDGLAASIASVIALAGDERVTQTGGMWMVHEAFGLAVGSAEEMAKMAQTLDQVSANLAGVYAQRCGGTAAGWREVMRAETWYTADEAVAAGLAHRVGGEAARLPASAGLAAAHTMPGRIAARLRELPQASALRAPDRPRAVTTAGRDVPAGAALDSQPWAASWGSFLAAVRDRDDKLGARAMSRRVMDATRVRNSTGLSERIPSEGGVLVPERLRSRILTYMTKGVISRRATPITMDSLRVPIPVLDNPNQSTTQGPLGGLIFAMVEEGAAITPTTPAFGAMALEARKAMGYLQGIPNELLEDATPFTEDFLPRIIGMGLDWWIDDMCIYVGSGVGEPQALVNAPGAVTVTRGTASKILHADVIGMLKQLHPASKSSAVWLASEDAWDWLLEVYFQVGTAPSGQDVSPPNVLLFNNGKWELFGVEIIPNDHQPSVGTQGDLMLVDLSLYLLGLRNEMTIDIGDQVPGQFASAQSDIRIRQRIDARFWPQQTITLANGKITSPLVVLQ